MTPKTLVLTLIATLTVASQALAAGPVRPGQRPGAGRERGPGPVVPGHNDNGRNLDRDRQRERDARYNPPRHRPGPVRPGPIHPIYPREPIYPAPIYRDTYIQRTMYVNRYIGNETIFLQSLLDFSPYYAYYRVESINVEISQAGYNTSLRLLVNGYTEDSDSYVTSYSTLRPSYRSLGSYLAHMAVHVSGSAYVRSITVNLVRN